ncbi:MAG: hypothetical protein ACKO1J_17760, partial [Tagaea sp.]
LDAKTDLFDYERWNSDWARNATDPASFAPEYESYIRQIEPTHGHDPGLIYARDFAQKVEKRRGKGGEFVQSLLARLADRPDLQREFLGGAVPHHPPQGTFRPGGEAGVKDWIDQDRIANGIAPKFSKAAQTVQAVGQIAPILANVAGAVSGAAGGTGAADAPTEGPAPETPQAPEPDYRNLLEYVNNFGFPGTEPPQAAQSAASETGADEQPMTYDDLSDTAKAIASGVGRSRGEPGVQIAMATPGQIPFEPIREFDVTQLDGAWSKLPASPPAQPGAATAKPPPTPPTEQPPRSTSQHDPRSRTSQQLEIDVQNAQLALDEQNAILQERIDVLGNATAAREGKEAEIRTQFGEDALKGAVQGGAQAIPEAARKSGGGGTGRARVLRTFLGGVMDGVVQEAVPPQARLMNELEVLRQNERNAVQLQGQALVERRKRLEYLDEIAKEREARRNVRPDQ